MSDINQFIITGVVEEVLLDNKGWASIKTKTIRTLKDKEDQHIISTTIWGEKSGDLHAGDKVIIQGYLTGRNVQKKDGGHFIAESRMATVIKKIGGSEKQELQAVFDEEIPF